MGWGCWGVGGRRDAAASHVSLATVMKGKPVGQLYGGRDEVWS